MCKEYNFINSEMLCWTFFDTENNTDSSANKHLMHLLLNHYWNNIWNVLIFYADHTDQLIDYVWVFT